MNDFEYQQGFVIDASWRMLEMQDRNPLSPSYGCFHYAYWRDKTSEFSDARFQEAGAALALLSLPEFDSARNGAGLPPSPVLYRAFSAALRYWAVSQYDEGCWDEWYKGERGFAATEFTMIAYGLAARYMGASLLSEDRERLVETMRKAAAWIASRDDGIKANHEAAAGAALALAWETTGIESFRTAARQKITDTLARQTDEGWFPEVGGMDLGYCSVLLDYVMIYVLVTGDNSPVSAMRKLLAFMVPHLHPDATISPEAGLCLNPFVSRLGIGLLSAHDDDIAAAIVETLDHLSPGRKGLSPYLADDLRLLRWSYLPVVAMLERNSFRPSTGAGADALVNACPDGWTVREKSAIGACHAGRMHVYVSVAGGGAVRVYWGRDLICEDIGVDVVTADNSWGSAGYSLNREIVRISGGIRFRIAMGKATFFYPGFVSRLVLRIGSTTPHLSRLLRQAIDWYRVKNGTAINQSAAPLADDGEVYVFDREVLTDHNSITIADRVKRTDGLIDSRSVRLNLDVAGEHSPVQLDDFQATAITIKKLIRVDGDAWKFSVEVEHC